MYPLLIALGVLIALAGIVDMLYRRDHPLAGDAEARRRLDALATTEDRDFHLQGESRRPA